VKIGIIGAGMIGATLARRLGEAGHEVAIANSRGPQTIDEAALVGGARAVEAQEAPRDVDVLVLSVPLAAVPGLAPLVHAAPEGAVVIDTSNYYPVRDGSIDELEGGTTESAWVQERLGRPVVKAWNAITAQSFAALATAPGASGRLAIPVAGDDAAAKSVARSLVDQTGFDAVDAGTIADSWRQQPGTPAYCTDRTADELVEALAAADAARSPRRRDFVMAVLSERAEAEGSVSPEYVVRLNRAIY
jgi:predicted dinucleotide-binding enzyme